MKKCRQCGKRKQIDQFASHPHTIDKHRAECKSCGVINATNNRKKIRKMWRQGKLIKPNKKLCPKCGTVKLAKEFPVNLFRKMGLDTYCFPCGRSNHEKMRRNNPKLYLWKSAKYRAKQENIKFTISLNDLPDIPKFCPALGIKLRQTPKKAKKGGFQDSLATIDRKISLLGYIPGNVVIVSWLANRIKSSATPEQISSLAKFYGFVS